MSFGITHATWFRLLGSAVVGTGAGVGAAAVQHQPLAVMVGWIVTATVFCGWTWLQIGRMDADTVKEHATREDPGRAVGDIVVLAASLVALVGVGVLIMASGQKGGGSGHVEALVGVLAVAASWFTVHTLFTLRYARLYHLDEGDEDAIDFNDDEDPTYADFAYLAFTVGMTYQVSDTDLKTRQIRHTVLRHALLSFLLGAVVIACTINLVSQLAGGGQ